MVLSHASSPQHGLVSPISCDRVCSAFLGLSIWKAVTCVAPQKRLEKQLEAAGDGKRQLLKSNADLSAQVRPLLGFWEQSSATFMFARKHHAHNIIFMQQAAYC